MSISKLATTRQTTPHTVRLLGKIAGKEVLILVDSGSSHSFISGAVASRLADQVQNMEPIIVKIADGGLLDYTQGHTFQTDLRVLRLGCYDMVEGNMP